MDYQRNRCCWRRCHERHRAGNGVFQWHVACGADSGRVIAGYVLAAMMGLVDFAKIASAPWFAVPHFITPEVNWAAALFMLPVAVPCD